MQALTQLYAHLISSNHWPQKTNDVSRAPSYPFACDSGKIVHFQLERPHLNLMPIRKWYRGIIDTSLPSPYKLFNEYLHRSQNTSGGASGGKSSGAIRTIGVGELTPGGTQLDSLTPNGKGIRSVDVSGGRWQRLKDELKRDNCRHEGVHEDREFKRQRCEALSSPLASSIKRNDL